MLYMVECGFADPDQEEAWNTWYNGEKIDELLANPGFIASQRFRSLTPRAAPYLAIHSIESADVFTDPGYASTGGGRFGDWDPALMTDWTRRLFDGMDESPAVDKDHLLLIADGYMPLQDAGVSVTWLDGLDWDTVGQYKDAVALDASVSRRGIAVVAKSEQVEVSKFLGIRLYEPISEKRKSS